MADAAAVSLTKDITKWNQDKGMQNNITFFHGPEIRASPYKCNMSLESSRSHLPREIRELSLGAAAA